MRVGKQTIGVAVPLSHLRTENGWRALAGLADACDFLAIDVGGIESTDAEAVLQSLGYYREEYGTRIVIREGQTDLIAALKSIDVSDYQIISEAE